MNIGFIGSAGPFSTLALEFLLNSKHTLSFVACDACNSDPRFPIMNDSIESLAIQNAIESIDLQQIQSLALNKPIFQRLDIIIVACYGRKIPATLLKQAKWGGVNCHPSLLPAFRGPVPIFWQFKQAAPLGISLHKMTSNMDAGAIISQKTVTLEDGLSQQQIFTQLMQAGLPLLEQLLDKPQQAMQNAHVQEQSLASRMSYPQANDFAINSQSHQRALKQYSAKNIFNFMRATAHFQQNYPCQLADKIVLLSTAISYHLTTENIPALIPPLNDREIIIPCSDGYLLAQLADLALNTTKQIC
jgi:methionyl-tRNA formyltransferase